MFNRGVNEALHNTVDRLEDIHNLGVVKHMVFQANPRICTHELEHEFDSDFDEDVAVNTDSTQVFLARQKEGQRPIRILYGGNLADHETIVEIKIDEEFVASEGEQSVQYSYNNDSLKKHIVFKGTANNGNGILFVGTDTILSDTDSIYTLSAVKIDSLLTDLEEIDLVKSDVSARARLKATRLKYMANKVVTEFSEWDVRRVDADLVYDVLKKELNEKHIPIDFDFGIQQNNKLTFPKVVQDSTGLVNSLFKVNLYPNDIFQKNIKLAVSFPGKEGFIYRSLSWLLVGSSLFSVIILLTFGLSIYYILRQKKISEMKSDFINNMTHEFKTPIATISVATDSIVNQKVLSDPERIRYFAGMIKKENIRMNSQVEDLLTIARLDKKDFEFSWEAIDVHELINDAVQGIILQIEKRGGKIDLSLNAANSVVTTDGKHCTNLVYNLIDNANKYSTECPQIKVSTKNMQKGVLISVKDKGIGMSKAVQTKIFERFYRQTSGNIHNVKGFGLGLSYVKAVLEANKGTISVRSETDKGSTFDVFLPFVRE